MNKCDGLSVYGNGCFVGVEKQKKRYNKNSGKRIKKLLKSFKKTKKKQPLPSM